MKQMEKEFGKRKTFGVLLLAVCYMAVGILLLLVPQMKLIHLCWFFGWAMIASGVVMIVLYFLRENYRHLNEYGFSLGVAALILGVCLLIRAEQAEGVLSQLFGVCILMMSILKLQNSMALLSLQEKYWWIHLLVAVATAVLAGIILINPFKSKEDLQFYTNIVLIIDGILSIYSIVFVAVKLRRHKGTLSGEIYEPALSKEPVEEWEETENKDADK